MTAETIIQFLKIFGLIVFDMFFLMMTILSIYMFFTIINLKKAIIPLQDEIRRIITNFEQDFYSITDTLKSKIESIDSRKVMLGSTLFGGVFSLFSRGLFRKKKSRGIVKSIIDIFL